MGRSRSRTYDQWQPWGGAHILTGAQTLNERFPGHWFQLESGLYYNWHRHYDPSLGRYTQPDPLGFVDGPGVYGYGRNSPQRYVDKDGRTALVLGGPALPEIIALCLANPVLCTVIIVTPPIIAYCMASTPANDNNPPAPPPTITNCQKAFEICLKANGGLLSQKSLKCRQSMKACLAGSTTIFGPGLVGSPE